MEEEGEEDRPSSQRSGNVECFIVATLGEVRQSCARARIKEFGLLAAARSPDTGQGFIRRRDGGNATCPGGEEHSNDAGRVLVPA